MGLMDPPLTKHPLVGKTIRWKHGPNVLVGPATHYDATDDELFIIPDGLTHGHYWVPASECTENPNATCPVCNGTGGYWADKWQECRFCDGDGRVVSAPTMATEEQE